ncbi:MAG: hypothetical protein Q9205_005868 [Flavoplaca limonia]
MHLIAFLSFFLIVSLWNHCYIANAASIIRASRPTCWDDSDDNARFIPVVFRECIQIINDDITRGHDIDVPLKFSFDPTFQPDIQLPKYWKRPGVNCGVGVDLAPGLEGYDRTTLRDIKDAARAVAIACVIRPPHAGGYMQVGWHHKLGVLISGQRALSMPRNGTRVIQQVERLPDIASSNLITSPRMHYYQIKKVGTCSIQYDDFAQRHRRGSSIPSTSDEE